MKLGDVFQVPLQEGQVGYVQYVAEDESMLDSSVIRAFEGVYDTQRLPDISNIVAGDIHFHAHVFLKACLKFGFWRNIGNAPPPKTFDVLFRASWDHGNPVITISHRWYTWRINQPFRDVGVLKPEYWHAEIGCVLPPQVISERMRTGTLEIVYPGH